MCLEYTRDQYSYPAQPGTHISSATAPQVEDDCTDNYYCEGGTNTGTECPAGYLSMESTTKVGAWSQASCSPARAGYVQDGTSESNCQAGHYCPEGTAVGAELACPPGTWTSSSNAENYDDCAFCSAGSWCGGAATSEGACAAGYFCPERTIFEYEYPCKAGKTSSSGSGYSALGDCVDGDVGKFYKEGSTGYASVCSAEYYVCPAGAQFRATCDPGTHMLTSDTPADASSCTACSAGSYCEGPGPMLDCRAGYVSSGGASACSPTTAGEYASADGTGPSGSAAGDGDWSLAGDIEARSCEAGYYCASGTKTECSEGSYCAAGSSSESALGGGYVQDEAGLWYQKPCPAGYECPAGAGSAPSEVSTGSWAKQGTSDASTNACADGYACPGGSTGPYGEACPLGQYTVDGSTETGCEACPNGKYCMQATRNNCPVGFFCDNTDTDDNSLMKRCPAGSYRATEEAENEGECTLCDAGFGCTVPGASATTAACGAGYFCITGSPTTTPQEDMTISGSVCETYVVGSTAPAGCTGAICPPGYYCEKESAEPSLCPAGTFSNELGARTDGSCITCTEGYYCPTSSPRTACEAGEYCPEGATDACNGAAGCTVEKQTADPGYFTLEAFPDQVRCEPGTYQADSGQGDCDACDVGAYCDVPGMDAVTTCLEGHDCSAGSVVYPR